MKTHIEKELKDLQVGDIFVFPPGKTQGEELEGRRYTVTNVKRQHGVVNVQAGLRLNHVTVEFHPVTEPELQLKRHYRWSPLSQQNPPPMVNVIHEP